METCDQIKKALIEGIMQRLAKATPKQLRKIFICATNICTGEEGNV